MSKQPPPAPTASAVGPCPTVIQIVGRPGTGSYTQHHRTTRPPPPPTHTHPDGIFLILNANSVRNSLEANSEFRCKCISKFIRGYSTGPTPPRVGWLVGCFGFNGLLRQYFSLYRAVSQREGERGEKGQMRVKMSKQPPPALTASAVGPCPTVMQKSRTPRHWKFTQHLRTTRPPLTAKGTDNRGVSIHSTLRLVPQKSFVQHIG